MRTTQNMRKPWIILMKVSNTIIVDKISEGKQSFNNDKVYLDRFILKASKCCFLSCSSNMYIFSNKTEEQF